MVQLNLILNGSKGVVYPSELETCILNAISILGSQRPTNALIDFTQVKFIDIVSILNLISYTQSLVINDNNIIVKIKLPNNKKLLLFIERWSILKAFLEVTKKTSHRELLDEESIDIYETFITKTSELKSLEISKDKQTNDNYNKLYQNKFFEIKTFKIKSNETDELETGFLNNEIKRWDTEEIKEVLTYVLRDKEGNKKEGYIPSNIIFECLTNALRHPNGDILNVTSRFISSKNEELENDEEDHFTLVFWDNGTSMIDVLKNGFEANATVQAFLPNHTNLSYPLFKVNFKDSLNNKYTTWIDSKIGPGESFSKDYWDYYWFLSTFFPGVSSDPYGKTKFQNKDIKPPKSKDIDVFNNPGMGLYLLLNTVVDIFNGKIAVRSRDLLMNISSSSDTGKSKFSYDVNIKKINPLIPKFNGNLIAIHLPLYENN